MFKDEINGKFAISIIFLDLKHWFYNKFPHIRSRFRQVMQASVRMADFKLRRFFQMRLNQPYFAYITTAFVS
jgi:hypothetical protein